MFQRVKPVLVGVRLLDCKLIDEFVIHRQSVVRFVRDSITAAVDKQKASAGQRGHKNLEKFKIGGIVLMSTTSIPDSAVINLGAPKLAPRYIGSFKVIKVNGDVYQLDIPSTTRLHPKFCVGRLKRYWPAVLPSTNDQEKAHNAVPVTRRSLRVGLAQPAQLCVGPSTSSI